MTEATTNHYGIIDIGSNSIRLVIYSNGPTGRLHEIENVKAVARLKNDLDNKNRLSDNGIKKLIQILQSFRAVVETYELSKFHCVATATVREARNQEEMMMRVYEKLGWEIQILSEKEEAYYGYLAVIHSMSITEGITIDIGGGSTEVTYFKDRKLKASHSFPFGALTLQSFFHKIEPRRIQLKKLNTYLKNQFETIDWLKNKFVPLIAIGGSARNLVEIHQNKSDYPLAGLHQYAMTEKDLKDVCYFLAKLNKTELEKVDGLSKDRADTIFPASLVFLSLYQTVASSQFILSRKGLRDGFFYQLLATHQEQYPNVLKLSIFELVDEYDLDLNQIKQTGFLSDKIFTYLIQNKIAQVHPDDWTYLKLASYVYHLGQYVDSESSSEHTFYLLANRTIEGMTHPERVRVALLASFKNGSMFKKYLAPFTNWFSKQEQDRLYLLGALLKLAYSLDTTRRQVIKDVKLEGEFELTFYCDQDFMPEQNQAEKQKKHLEKAIGKDIQLIFNFLPS